MDGILEEKRVHFCPLCQTYECRLLSSRIAKEASKFLVFEKVQHCFDPVSLS